MMDWQGSESEIGSWVLSNNRQTLAAYEKQKKLIDEQAAVESHLLSGAYGTRQLYELIQNGADAVAESGTHGRITVLLSKDALYCANEGTPLDRAGAESLLMAHISPKRGPRIGRFGIGFKSVLGVSDTPRFFSRTGSFVFDPQFARQEIERAVGPWRGRVPTLRLARPVDPRAAAERDPRLAMFMEWAATVVMLPLKTDPARLSEDMAKFPAEFMLFSPHVSRLTLKDGVTQRERTIEVAEDGAETVLTEGNKTSRWRIFQCVLAFGELPEDVRATLTSWEPERSSQFPILWAVPMDQHSRGQGRFWSFFPTSTELSVSGILNAPWSLTTDREAVIDAPLNKALIRKAAGLIADSLKELFNPEDPGSLLDLLPARDESSDPARLLSQVLMELLKDRRVVPDGDGSLCLASSLKLRPFPLGGAVRQQYGGLGSRKGWVHPSVEDTKRRSRAERLGGTVSDVVSWLEDVAAEKTVRASITAILLSREQYRGHVPDGIVENMLLSHARIILGSDGELTYPGRPDLYLPDRHSAGALTSESVCLVHPEVAADVDARKVLTERWRIHPFSPMAALQRYMDVHPIQAVDWAELWPLTRGVPPAEAAAALLKWADSSQTGQSIRVRTESGEYKPIADVLLPGGVLEGRLVMENRGVAVDMKHHAADRELLDQLGVVAVPRKVIKLDANGHGDYRVSQIRLFTGQLPPGSPDPQSDFIIFTRDDGVGPAFPLLELEDYAAARLVELLLPLIEDEAPWHMKHRTQAHRYGGNRLVDSPALWAIRKRSILPSSHGPCKLEDAVASSCGLPRTLFPVVDCSSAVAGKIGIPAELSRVHPAQWDAAFRLVQESEDPEEIVTLYLRASEAAEVRVPATLRCQIGQMWGSRPPGEVVAAWRPSTVQVLVRRQHPFIRCLNEEDARCLVSRWGLRPEPEWPVRFELPGEEELLIDSYPGMRSCLAEDQKSITLVPCQGIFIGANDGDATIETVECLLFNGRVYFNAGMTDVRLIAYVSNELGLQLGAEDLSRIAKCLVQRGREKTVERIREQSTPGLKLIAAIGEEAAMNRLPSALKSVVQALGGHDRRSALGRVLEGRYGIELFSSHKSELDSAGLSAPVQWAGRQRAKEFVAELGLPEIYAGVSSAAYMPYEDVEGPIALNPLHVFQRQITAGMMKALRRRKEMSRGMLSLPTGAGKTRVTVESLVRVMRRRALTGLFLWIAQTDELCEQAVICWRQVWRTIGYPETMRVLRFWGRNNSQLQLSPAQNNVVVATYQTLRERIHNAEFKELLSPACVVVDEAHGTNAPSYTDIFNAMGITPNTTPCHLIGLTATPFRSSDDEKETQRLVNRFEANRFDGVASLGGDPYIRLQDTGYLAHVDHKLLPGAEIQLTDADRDQLDRFDVLSTATEERLARNMQRNDAVIRHISSLPSDWAVLVFAISVEHAEILSALLSMKGVVAQPISGTTNVGARRYYVEQFKRGGIRVLANYSVLAAGFDAPAVRSLIIARPVFSKVQYQQMIGRGLRGPKNGGKERCEIVNIEDNLAQYGEKLAFRHFEYLWGRESAP